MNKIRLIIIILLLNYHNSLSQGIGFQDAIVQYDLAKKEISNKNYKSALTILDSLIKKAEKDQFIDIMPDLYLDRAKCNLQLGNKETICEDLAKALDFNIRESIDLMKSNCPDLIKSQDQIAYYLEIGSKHNFNKEYEEALTYLNKVVAEDPNNEMALSSRAFSYQMTNQLNQALEDFNTLIKINPDNHEYYWYRAEVFYELKKFQDALLDLNTSLELDPTNTFAVGLRGIVYNALGDYENALTDLNRVIDEWPSSENYFERAKAYFKIGDKEKACEDLNKIPLKDQTDEIRKLKKDCG